MTGETYEIKDGYLDLLKARTGADNIANLANFLPGAGRGYEPLWRVRSLSLLTGEPFPKERELEIIKRLVRPPRRPLPRPGLLRRPLHPQPRQRCRRRNRHLPVHARGSRPPRTQDRGECLLRQGEREESPFLDASFEGAVCGGTLNELGDPARALRETTVSSNPAGGSQSWASCVQARRGRRLQRFLSTGGIRFFDPDELQSLLDHAGFEPDPPQSYGPVFFSGLPDGADATAMLYKASTVSGVGRAPWAPASVTAAAPARTA